MFSAVSAGVMVGRGDEELMVVVLQMCTCLTTSPYTAIIEINE
jgi:hypothetical protein